MSGYVIWTPKEGRWSFTASSTPGEAMDKFSKAAAEARILTDPIDNEPQAIRIELGGGFPLASVIPSSPT